MKKATKVGAVWDALQQVPNVKLLLWTPDNPPPDTEYMFTIYAETPEAWAHAQRILEAFGAQAD